MAGALHQLATSDSKKNFIKGAIKRPGRLTAAAKRAGESISKYAREHEHDPRGTIGDAARMYEHVLKPASRKKAA